jgi:hypothetical protein
MSYTAPLVTCNVLDLAAMNYGQPTTTFFFVFAPSPIGSQPVPELAGVVYDPT